MTEKLYPALGERVFRERLENGLTVAVVKRPGFRKKLAYFVTDWGSIHREFALDGENFRVPAGVAHYLEHKLFDMPGGRDVSAEFAALGASVNAFTSYDLTAYYFSCTESFEQCLRLLLEFVSTPYFTTESVEKEQGIIGQEIDMTADTPDNRLFENLMEAMYEAHPVRDPILGSRESIAQITAEVLHTCHRAYYHPGSMMLCVVGDVEPEQVVGAARQVLPADPGPMAQKLCRWDEPMTCSQKEVTASMEVAMPMFQLGFKCRPAEKGEAAVLQEFVGDLAAELLFGESSELYLRLYEEGLIDSSFGGGFETVDGLAMLTCSGDSDDPHAIREAILRRARDLVDSPVDEKTLLRMKRSSLGRRIKGLDSFDSTCFRLCAYFFDDYDYFRFPELYGRITEDMLRQFLSEAVTEERSCLSVIYPREG